MNTWYTHAPCPDDSQGLVYDEQTGRNIAVTYDPKDAPLVAAAPELLEVLENLLAAYDSQSMTPSNQYPPMWNNIRAIIQKAKGDL